MVSMLQKLEWQGEIDGCSCCPRCFAVETAYIGDARPGCGRHYENCELAQLLTEVSGEAATNNQAEVKP